MTPGVVHRWFINKTEICFGVYSSSLGTVIRTNLESNYIVFQSGMLAILECANIELANKYSDKSILIILSYYQTALKEIDSIQMSLGLL